jgi:hypothetical protein
MQKTNWNACNYESDWKILEKSSLSFNQHKTVAKEANARKYILVNLKRWLKVSVFHHHSTESWKLGLRNFKAYSTA